MAYTPHTARVIMTNFFFAELGASSRRKTFQASVKKAKQKFFTGTTSMTQIKSRFGHSVFKFFLEASVAKCLGIVNKRGIEYNKDDEYATRFEKCSVCLENKAVGYLIHGGTAHKCVCSKCAMDIALRASSNKKPPCPICREDISLVVECSTMSFPCVCKQDVCGRKLVVEIERYEDSHGPGYRRERTEVRLCLKSRIRICLIVEGLLRAIFGEPRHHDSMRGLECELFQSVYQQEHKHPPEKKRQEIKLCPHLHLFIQPT